LPAALGGGKATAEVTVGQATGIADIEISPQNPTTNDNISIKISGIWPNGCVPQNPHMSIVGNEVRINTSNQSQVCTQSETPWSHTLDIGRLAAGDYRVIVTHTGQGIQTRIGRAIFTVRSSPAITRILRVVNTTANSGGSASVPITLDSQGDENAVGFSLSFDTALLSDPQVVLGSGAAGAFLTVNANQAAQGRLGILLALPAGEVFAAGLRRIIVVNFVVPAGTMPTSTAITPSDEPVARQASDVNANGLRISSASGTVTILQGPDFIKHLEADVAPRPSGDGTLTISDCVQAGRFVAGLDVPTTGDGGEFQRADSAPRNSRGDGRLTITDWVQACRFAAFLDEPQAADGPLSPAVTSSSALAGATAIESSGEAAEARSVRAFKVGDDSGESTISVALDARGNENALGFSLRFDPSRWRFVSATAGSDANGATLNINENHAAIGRIGIALSFPSEKTFAAGVRELVIVKLAAKSSLAENSAAIAFDDYPVAREVADEQANSLTTRFAGVGTLSTVAVVSAASYDDKALASGSIATAFGTEMALSTESAAALPLPKAMAGTMLKMRDSAGIEHTAPLFFASFSQINYQVPAEMSPGPAAINITLDDGRAVTGTTQIVKVWPGLFTANSSGTGAAAGLVLRIRADGSQSNESLVRFDHEQNKFAPAAIDLGEETDQVFLILFGTGFSAISSTSTVSVKVGGVDVPVLYAGAQRDYAGMDQLNLRLPRSLMGKGEVDVTLTVDSITSNAVRVSIY
ncbi:MAG: hypothetical protein L0Z53_01010, partial [Acidobacteriales bacterium]|nr:hypothetical protein [Terriglobales bacterium]